MRPHLSVDFESDSAAIEANRTAYGVAWPRLSFQDAKLIVSFGADFLDGWGMSVPQQLDFADARAKIEGAPRFVYIGPRRSLTGLNADQWIACRPGTELAIANALAGKGSIADAATASGVAAATLDPPQAGALGVHAGARARGHARTRCARARAGRRRDQSGERRQWHDDPSRGSRRLRSTPSRAPPTCSTSSSGCAPASCRSPSCAASIRPTRFRPSARFAEAFAKVPFKVSFSMYPDETTELCDLDPPRPALARVVGRRTGRPRARSRCSSRRWIRCSAERAPRPTCSSSWRRRIPPSAARYPQADYRDWLIARASGRRGGVHRRRAEGRRRGRGRAAHRAGAGRRRARAGRAADRRVARRLLSRDLPVAAARRRSRREQAVAAGASRPGVEGAVELVGRDPSRSGAQARHRARRHRRGDGPGRQGARSGLSCISASARTRSRSRSVRGTRPRRSSTHSSRSTPTRAPFSGATVATRAASARARTISSRARTDRAGGLALVSTKVTLAKTGEHETLVSTEGSARQHGRGIAQALTVTQLAGLQPSRGAENANALAPQGSANQESGGGGSQGEGAGGKAEGNRGEHEESIPGEPSGAVPSRPALARRGGRAGSSSARRRPRITARTRGCTPRTTGRG